MPYLRAQVKDYALPEFINRLNPIVELTWSAPTGGGNGAAHHIYHRARGHLYGGSLAVWR